MEYLSLGLEGEDHCNFLLYQSIGIEVVNTIYNKLWATTMIGTDEKWLTSLEQTHLFNDLVACLSSAVRIVEVSSENLD